MPRASLTIQGFRNLALGLPGAVEGEHMGHPDFRANGRIFASIPRADEEWGMVKLTPEQQAKFIADASGAFTPASGAWGRQGCTLVDLARARVGRVRQALMLAFDGASDRRPSTTRGKADLGTPAVQKTEAQGTKATGAASRRRLRGAPRTAEEKGLVTHVALLRGVNVGGKNILPMQNLCDMFSQEGCTRVRSYIQSGNVVFCAPARQAERLAGDVCLEIERMFGFRPQMVVRTAKELAHVVASNPFLSDGSARTDENALYVGFLAQAPTARQVLALDANRSPGDSFAVKASEVYLRLSRGVAGTRLTNAWFDSALNTTCTIRNWRTVKRLAEMARGITP